MRRRVAAAAPLPPRGIPHPTLASAAVSRASPPLPQWLGLRQGRRVEFSSGPSFHQAEAPCSLISRTIERGGGRKCACKQAASAAGRDMLARKQGEEPGQQVGFHMNTALQLGAAMPAGEEEGMEAALTRLSRGMCAHPSRARRLANHYRPV